MTIENRSGRAVAVTATDFALVTAGERFKPSDALRLTADFEGAKSPWFVHDRSSSFIPRVEFIARIVTAAGKHVGDVRLPFVRR